jgi:hypothetical protein
MDKLSQKEMLEEGFLDAVRTAGRIASAPIKKIGRGIAKTAEVANKLDREGFGILKDPLNRFINSDPKQFVEKELKESYSKTFNPKSIRVMEVKNDTLGQRNVPHLPKVKTGTNRFIVSFKAERFKAAGGVSPLEIYYAHVFKSGVDNTLSMDVRDVKGNQIQGEKSKKSKKSKKQLAPSYDEIINKYSAANKPITVAILSTIITKNLGISEQDYAKKLSQGATDMDAAILDITGKMNVADNLDATDIERVKQVLQSRALVEKTNVSQKVLIEQLKRQ